MQINCLHPEAQLYVITVIYVISSITPYKINKFWSKFNFISSIMGIYVLHTMFGKDD